MSIPNTGPGVKTCDSLSRTDTSVNKILQVIESDFMRYAHGFILPELVALLVHVGNLGLSISITLLFPWVTITLLL